MREHIVRIAFGISIVLASLGGVASCSPTLSSRVSLPVLEPSLKDSSRIRGTRYGLEVFLEHLNDVRPHDAIAEYDGKDILPDGDVSRVVAEGLRKGLEQKGFRITENAPVLLAGEIRAWHGKVKGGYTSKVETHAALYIEVLDPTNRRVYSGVYQGNSLVEKPGFEDKDLRKALGTSMSEAVSQVLNDQQIIKLLSAF